MEPGSRSFRVAIIIGAVAVATGAALVVFGHTLPVYQVPYEQAQAAYQAWCTAEPAVDHAAGDLYLAMFGWHYRLMNAGSAVAVAGMSVGALALFLRITEPELPWLRTPKWRWVFVALGIAAMLGYLPGFIYGLSADLERQYFPWCADSIGIPIMGIGAAALLATPILALIGGLTTRGFGPLPAPLGQWDVRRPVRSWTVTLVFGAALLGGLSLWGLSILSSDMITPSSVTILYLLASTRAALLAPIPQSDPATPPNA